MSELRLIEDDRQRLGRRLGREPYYVVAERGPGLLRLESRPEANRGAGLRILAGAGALLLVGAVVVVSGLTSAATGAGFAVAALATVVGALFGALGYQRAVGGYAVVADRLGYFLGLDAGSEFADTVVGIRLYCIQPHACQNLAFASLGLVHVPDYALCVRHSYGRQQPRLDVPEIRLRKVRVNDTRPFCRILVLAQLQHSLDL